MRNLKKLTMSISMALLGAAGFSSRPVAATEMGSTNCTREQEEANKQVVMKGFGGDFNSFIAAVGDTYVQHSPEFQRFGELNGVQGRQLFPLLNQAFKLTHQGGPPKPPPGTPPENKSYMILAQCDLVTTVVQSFEPDPLNPGKFYPTYRFDVFRVKDGKLVEHWDGGRIPNPPPEYLKAPVKDLKAKAGSN